MKRPRFRWLIPLGLILLPPLFWTLVLAIAPTDWARTRIIDRLSHASGRSVAIGGLRVGTFGGVRLTDLAIGAPGSAADPWLKVAEARIDVGVLELLFGQDDLSEIEVSGLDLRVLRRADGALELTDFLQPTPAKAPTDSSTNTSTAVAVAVKIHDSRVHLIDEPSQTRLDFVELEGTASWVGGKATIQDLHGTLNGGPFELAAHLDRSGASPTFEGQLRAKQVALKEGMNVLSYLAPVLAGTEASAHLDGRLDLDLYLRGGGMTRDELQTSLVGNGKIRLDPIQLDGTQLLAELGSIVEMPGQARVGTIASDFAIKDGRIITDDLTVSLAKLSILLSGSTSFDGDLSYRLKTDNLVKRLHGKARDLLNELSIDPNTLTDIKVQGTVDQLAVSVDGVPLNRGGGAKPGNRGDDRRQLRDLSRKLRDRILR